MNMPASHPILSPAEARTLETELFAGDESAEWSAMTRAGAAVARAILDDYREIGGFPTDGRVLVLVGKGHNGGDALLAAAEILEKFPAARAEVIFVFGIRALRPLALQAWRRLSDIARERGATVPAPSGRYVLSLDGIFGFQFRPPVGQPAAKIISAANKAAVLMRAAIDLPSGLGEAGATFQADFTYATGSVKSPLLDKACGVFAGRIRYLDLGFFSGKPSHVDVRERVLLTDVLEPLRGWRRPSSDKRDYGHLFVIGGSRSYPGAVMMSVLAALKAGAGLVTAFVPESLAAAYAAHVPEAMWVGWPETPEGGLALEGSYLLRERISRADALLIGPGLSREAEVLALAADVVKTSTVPLVIDADALRPEIVGGGNAPRILTPHAGEFARIAGENTLADYTRKTDAVVVLKGAITRVSAAGDEFLSFFGGPVLARGGSGDLLAGMAGALAAADPDHLLNAAARAVVWHGRAADLLARERGQVAVHTTEFLDFLPAVLRET